MTGKSLRSTSLLKPEGTESSTDNGGDFFSIYYIGSGELAWTCRARERADLPPHVFPIIHISGSSSDFSFSFNDNCPRSYIFLPTRNNPCFKILKYHKLTVSCRWNKSWRLLKLKKCSMFKCNFSAAMCCIHLFSKRICKYVQFNESSIESSRSYFSNRIFFFKY